MEENGMEYSIEMTSIDDQIPLLPQTEKDEVVGGSTEDHIIDERERIDKMLKDLVNSIKSIEVTIFKVNVGLRESNPGAYTPKVISIGPYHKNNYQLRPMENYKLLYLRRFLKRNERFDVKSCISELEEDTLKCYEDIKDLDTNEFCQMLLLDGCFVVEFIRECCGIYPEEVINSNVCHIFRDLMLLENQLPFFVLDKLHEMTKLDHEPPFAMLVGISFPFIVDLPEKTLESFIDTGECYNSKHLLHLVHRLSCHGNPMKEPKDDDHMVMPNATELFEGGVSFAKVSVTTSLFDSIKFKNGVMTIPCFKVVDSTETLLRNLIAYEQQSFDVQPKYFSDFAMFMDFLIDSAEDVNLLHQNGIIENWIGDDKGVASVFNKIGNGITVYPDFYYKEECRKAIEHRKNPRNSWKPSFIRDYCSSPWVGASTAAAIVLLVLTAIQTILAFTGPVKK